VAFYKQQFERVQEDMKLFNQVLDEISNRERNIYRVALGAPDMPESIRSMGVGGTKRYMELEGYSYSELVKRTRAGIDALQGKLYAQVLSFKEIEKIALEQDERLASIPSIQPVSNKDLKRLASGFGWRVDPVYRTPRMHWGLDFTASVGTEVYATGEGTIESIETLAWGYGKNIVINHGYGYKTRYAHLSAFKVKVGQKVKDVISDEKIDFTMSFIFDSVIPKNFLFFTVTPLLWFAAFNLFISESKPSLILFPLS
jgi:murein DD-endopeptidase MepM/ murein hydrolase activator NlpD